MMPTCISLVTLSKLDSFPIPSNGNNKIELEDEAVMKNTERGIKSFFSISNDREITTFCFRYQQISPQKTSGILTKVLSSTSTIINFLWAKIHLFIIEKIHYNHFAAQCFWIVQTRNWVLAGFVIQLSCFSRR